MASCTLNQPAHYSNLNDPNIRGFTILTLHTTSSICRATPSLDPVYSFLIKVVRGKSKGSGGSLKVERTGDDLRARSQIDAFHDKVSPYK